MAFEPKKIDLNEINENTEYKKGDVLQPSAVNEIVKGILYAQENAGSGTNIEIDSELSLESENAVQNKVVTEALNGKLEKYNRTNATARVYYLYGVDSKNEQKMYMATYGAVSTNAIAAFDGYGCLTSNSPRNSSHVATKGYVDDLIANTSGGGTYLHQITLTYEVTSTSVETDEIVTANIYYNINLVSNSKNELTIEDFRLVGNEVELVYMTMYYGSVEECKFIPISCITVLDMMHTLPIVASDYNIYEIYNPLVRNKIDYEEDERELAEWGEAYFKFKLEDFSYINNDGVINKIVSVTDTVIEQ